VFPGKGYLPERDPSKLLGTASTASSMYVSTLLKRSVGEDHCAARFIVVIQKVSMKGSIYGQLKGYLDVY
jgi:hypothetical protein